MRMLRTITVVHHAMLHALHQNIGKYMCIYVACSTDKIASSSPYFRHHHHHHYPTSIRMFARTKMTIFPPPLHWNLLKKDTLLVPFSPLTSRRPFKLLFFRSQNYAENISKYFSTSSSSAWSLDSVDSLVSLVDAARLGRSGPCCFAEVRPKGRNKMLNVLSWFAGIFEA